MNTAAAWQSEKTWFIFLLYTWALLHLWENYFMPINLDFSFENKNNTYAS